MSNEHPTEPPESDEARLAALVRAAAISLPSEAARARAETQVRAAWLESLRESNATTAPQPDTVAPPRSARRTWSLAAGVAALAVFAAFAWRSNAPQMQVAQLEQLSGTVEVRSAGWFAHSRPATRAMPIALQDVVSANADSIATLRMPSGLSIRMRAGTRVAFAAHNQLMLERGAIYVDAVPGSDPSFTVATAVGNVRHLGTRYQVEFDRERMVVAVRDGAVAVAVDGRAEERANVGTVVSIGVTDRRILRTAVARHDERFAWIEAQPAPFALEGAQLSDFLAWFTHETGIEIRFAPVLNRSQLEAVTLRGSIEGLAPLKALDVVLASVDLTYANFDGAIVIAAR